MAHKIAQRFRKDELVLFKGDRGMFMKYAAGIPDMAWIRLPVPIKFIKKAD
jgi:hypothetical protein